MHRAQYSAFTITLFFYLSSSICSFPYFTFFPQQVTLADKNWGVAPQEKWEDGGKGKTAANKSGWGYLTPEGKRKIEMDALPDSNWTMMAVELANDDQLSKWMKRCDKDGFGQMTGRIRGIPATPGLEKTQTLLMAEGPDIHLRIVRNVMARLLLHLKQQHAHGIVHFDLKPDNICIHKEDACYKIKMLDFGLARALAEQAVWKTSPGGTVGYKDPATETLIRPKRSTLRSKSAVAAAVAAARDDFAVFDGNFISVTPSVSATKCDVYSAGSIM